MRRTPVFGALVALALAGTLGGVVANTGEISGTPSSSTLALASSSARAAGSADVVRSSLLLPSSKPALDDNVSATSSPSAVKAKPRALARAAVVRTRIAIITLTVAYTVKMKKSSHYFRGQTRVLTTGRNGVRIKAYRISKVNGRVVRRVLIASHIKKQPRTKIVLVGTKLRPISRVWTGGSNIGRPEVDGLNWHALAICESQANPRAGGHHGPYYGMYQFLRGTWHSVGGAGYPSDASAAEQTYRAKLLFVRSGRGPWSTCGRRL